MLLGNNSLPRFTWFVQKSETCFYLPPPFRNRRIFPSCEKIVDKCVVIYYDVYSGIVSIVFSYAFYTRANCAKHFLYSRKTRPPRLRIAGKPRNRGCSMLVSLLRNKQIFSLTLPAKSKGQFWLVDLDDKMRSRSLISIEAVQNEWVVKSNKTVSILNANTDPIPHTALKPHDFYSLKLRNSDEQVLLFAEPVSEDRQILRKVAVAAACELTIGRAAENNICFDNRYVSVSHAVLSFDGSAWRIKDTNSTNGTFVNGFRVTEQALETGDLVYIMGLKLVVSGSILAINNPDGLVRLASSAFRAFTMQPTEPREPEDDEDEISYFYRSPRFKRAFETAQITIDPPPAVQKIDQVPLALMLGPSLTMGLTSLSTGILSLSNVMNNNGDIKQALPTLLMSVSMMLGTILWPLLTKRHEKKMKAKNEQKRQEKYLAYLNAVRDEIKRKCKEQSDILRENFVAPGDCAALVLDAKRGLWERIAGQDDFLRLRLGIGDLPMDAAFKIMEKKFSMEDDNLQNALFALGGEPKRLIDVPVSLSLAESFVTGIIGSRAEALSLMRSLLLQAVALHSYDELKIVCIVNKEELAQWEYVKWFPHIWNNERNVRYLATDADEVKEFSVMLDKSILAEREDDENTPYTEHPPYYLIVSAGMELALSCESFGKLLQYRHNAGFSIITLYDDLQNLPKETRSVIEITPDGARIFDKDDMTGKTQPFTADGVDFAAMQEVAEAIANIPMDVSGQRYTLPNMITLLEMFNVSKIEHLNALTRWKENNPVISLQTPVGVDTMGAPFLLDLHERFHGPHGLVAGMTGSGKSEFIITFILSLAINYHPDEVAFILIDYKGGGLTGAFEDEERGVKLPHLAGTITNLDGAAVKRSLISIQSELRRRQAIFNEARKISNEGTMDIYKYQQLYRDKTVPEPIPHLFIISDEFAELKTQQPEFMEQLISAARIGRSLGVHLILATQKPSGVVDDQIWSNSKFRVCLKVQEKADSMDMIKCPDAAALTQTGRFYLQVGFNELFALGQSAWGGAEYIPAETVEKKIDASIQIVDHLGRVVKEAKPSKKASFDGAKTKQVVAAVKYLSDLAKEEHIAVKPLWQDAIPPLIYVGELESKYAYKADSFMLNPVIGEYDDPFNQRKGLLTLPLTQNGNTIVYGATGNGKTTFLTTLLYALLKNHSADALHVYALDFGAETLRMFEDAPQVGGVLFSRDNDKIINLFKMLVQEMDDRKKLFAPYGGDFISYAKAAPQAKPSIVILLNNYSGFAEQFADLDETFALLSREGLKYGITFVITSGSTSAVRYRTQQNFSQLLTMQLNDANDYSLIVGKTEGLVPSKHKGRGLANLGRVYEFQTAHFAAVDDAFAFITDFCSTLRAEAAAFAKPVPSLPEIVTLQTLMDSVSDLTTVPVGVAKRSLSAAVVRMSSRFVYPVLAGETYQLQPFAQGFAEALAATGAEVRVLDAEQGFAPDAQRRYAYITDDFETEIRALFAELAARNNAYKDAQMNPAVLDGYAPAVVIVLGLAKLLGRLSDDGKDKCKVMLEKGEAAYKIHFVIADSAAGLSAFQYDAWFKKSVAGADGVWIGDGFTEQYVLKPNKVTSELYEEIGDAFGYVLSKNKPVLAKLLVTEAAEEEYGNA